MLDNTKQRSGRAKRSLESRFWSKVSVGGLSQCWQWNGSKNQKGYGKVATDETGTLDYAHRVSVRLSGREIPQGMEIDHQCRNTSCVNPNHLRVVTHLVNVRCSRVGQHFRNKVACPKGHPYDASNTMLRTTPSGGIGRACRACNRAWTRAAYMASRANREVA